MSERQTSVSDGAALWHGRFDVPPNSALMDMSRSLDFDKTLWWADIEGSKAHVQMLGSRSILAQADVDAIQSALDTVHSEFAGGTFVFHEADEDIHTAIERRVTQIAGPSGARMHTARSRNDQVATAMRLWCKREVGSVIDSVVALVEILDEKAAWADQQEPAVRLPGYTHLQHAQAILLSHHLRAHAWALLRDADRFVDALARLDESPLGAGALAGTSLPIDPAATASLLGFRSAFSNSLDAVSDRDFVAEILFDIALLGVHLSRMGEEWVLWTSSEFSFATLDDSFATGSSMLPQKKNADVAELARGKTGRFIGHATGFLATLKGLPLAYNRDLQEDKEPLFDSVHQVRLVISALSGMVATASFNVERMRQQADSEALVATDLAEYLVRGGMPFREAHGVVGAIVRESLQTGEPMVALVSRHRQLGPDAATLFAPGRSVALRTSAGGAGPEASAEQVNRLRERIEHLKARRRP